MLLMEVVVSSLRVSRHNGLNHQEYSEAMMMELKALDDHDPKKKGGSSLQ